MEKKTLEEYCNELPDIGEIWLNRYKEYVPRFIEEAKTKKHWDEWDKDVFVEFFERSKDQCVSSLSQGYFTKEEKATIKSNWSEISNLLRIIAENQESANWDIYQELKAKLRKHTYQDRKAATNRLVASLQPKLMCTIVNEKDLGDLIDKINKYTASHISSEGDWFRRSYNVHKLFQQELNPESTIDIITYPWKILEHLKGIESNLIEKQKDMEYIKNILLYNKNIILTGAPGTGKTYKTAEIAVALIDGSNNIPINRGELMSRYKELVNAKQIEFTTFHQSLDYEEFIEGLKPEVDDVSKEMTYQIKDGVFKEMCERAKEKGSTDSLNKAIEQFKEVCSENTIKVKNKSNSEFSVTYRGGKSFRVRSDKSEAEEGKDFPASIDNIKKMYQGNKKGIYGETYVWGILEYLKQNYLIDTYSEDNTDKKYVLIIDEINRGNISKIFGELITLLEHDKRIGEENEITVTLPYSQETFGVPSNLYIIGTMNTADRSIGHIDYAIRRRFSFVALKSDKNVISSYDKYDNGTKEKAEKLFDEIKAFISSYINADLDADDLMIGHSYFLCKTEEDLKRRLEYEMIPLIEEYEKDGIIMLDKSVMKQKFDEWRVL